MLADFSTRMAARIAAEDHMAEEDTAAEETNGADLEQPREDESAPKQEADQETQQQNEHGAPSAGEPRNPPLEANGLLEGE